MKSAYSAHEGLTRNSLSVVRKAVSSLVVQFRLASRVPTSDVRDNVRNYDCVLARYAKLSLCPGSHEGVEVARVPNSCVPAERREELDAQLVRLEVAYVENPNTVCLSVDGKR